MQKVFLDHTNSNAFKLANALSDQVWEIVERWEWFAKQTIGSQLIKSIDSIAANLAEGFGRYHKKDKQKFYYNARGSTLESIFWVEKSYKRDLIVKEEHEPIIDNLKLLPKEINWLISMTERKLKE